MDMKRKLIACIVIICLACTQSGCVQLLAIPFQLLMLVLAIPFYVMKIVIALLPIAIKYAPLALLFISNTDENASNDLEQLLNEMNTNGDVCHIELCALTEDISCYKIEFGDTPRNAGQLASHIKKLLDTDTHARIVFARKNARSLETEQLYSIWHYMQTHQIQVGQERDLILPDGEEHKQA